MSSTAASKIVRLTRRYRFSASHRLHAASLSEAENRDTFGKCNNPFGHGHNYLLDVTVRGRVDTCTGRVVSIDALDSLVQECILRDFDRCFLNVEVPEFGTLVPTSENVARVVEHRLRRNWAQLRGGSELDGIRLEETKRNHFELKT